MATTMVGNLIVNALIPPATPNSRNMAQISSLGPAAESPTLAISGAQNRALPFGVIPQVLGFIRLAPLKAHNTYTEIIGADQYLHVLLTCGIGPVEISDIRIGNTPITDYAGVEMDVRQGWPNEAPFPLFPYAVKEEALTVLLAGWTYVIRLTEPDADVISVDIVCPNGLYTVNRSSGNLESRSLNFVIRYRRAGSSDPWQDVPNSVTESYQEWVWDVEPHMTGAPGDFPHPTALNYFFGSGHYETRYYTWNGLKLTGATHSLVRGGIGWQVPRGQYEVLVEKMNDDDADSYQMGVSYWSALRTVRYRQPVNPPVPCSFIALRIKATDQLQGDINELTCMCRTIAPDWDKASQTWIWRRTDNPASLYLLVLQGFGNKKPLAADQIDLEKLQYWHEFCEANGFAYNRTIDFDTTVEAILGEIAAAGRATPGGTDTRRSVIIDEPQAIEKGVFTPRVAWGFKRQRTFTKLPHGWRMPFFNEQKDFAADEYIVLDDGYQLNGLDAWGHPAPDLPPATEFEQLELKGITNPNQLFKLGRYHIAVARLRNRNYTFNTDFLHLANTRGDLVRGAYDVTLWGSSVGRVKSLDYEITGYEEDGVTPIYGPNIAGVTLDEVMPMAADKSYQLRFWLAAFESLVKPVVTAAGSPKSVTFVTPITPAEDAPAVGDQALFGEVGRESAQLIIKEIAPQAGDMSAQLTCLDYAPAVYAAADGPIPAFDSQITQPPAFWPPAVVQVRSDDTVMILMANAWQPRILVDFALPAGLYVDVASVEAQYRVLGSTAISRVAAVPAAAQEISLMPVSAGTVYQFRLRFLMRDGKPLPWSEWQQHTCIGPSPLPAVSDLATVYRGSQLVLTWKAITAYPGLGYELRRGGNFDTAAIVDLVTMPEIILPGDGTYWLSAVTGYARSATPVSVVVAGAALPANVVATFDEFAEGWLGTRDNVEPDVSGNLILGQVDGMVDSAELWDAADLVDAVPAPYVAEAYYTSGHIVDVGVDQECNLSYEMLMEAVCDLATVDSDEMWDADQLVDGATPEFVGTQAQLNIYRSGGWLGWQNFLPGKYLGQKFYPRLKLTSSEPETSPSLPTFAWTVDMPDRLETLNLDVLAAGISVTFSPAFQVAPKLSTQIIGASEGDTAVISNLTKDGFDIRIMNSGSGVHRSEVHIFAEAY